MELLGPNGQPLQMPYHGTRTSWRVYHPAKNWNQDTKWRDVKKEFMRLYNEWLSVCDLYQEEQKLSEPVVSHEVRKDLMRLIEEIEKDIKHREYVLEALSEFLWDKPSHDEEDEEHTGRKCETHFFPTVGELKKRAEELRAMDSGLALANGHHLITPVKRSWAS